MGKNGKWVPMVSLTRESLKNVADEGGFNELPQGEVECIEVKAYADPATKDGRPSRVIANVLWQTSDGFFQGPISKKSILDKLVDAEGKSFVIEGDEISEA